MDNGKAITFSMEPGHLLLETDDLLPAAGGPQFALTIAFTPEGARNLRGMPLVYQDGDDYGRLVRLQVPKGEFVMGPEQADAIIDQDPLISEHISWWKRSKKCCRISSSSGIARSIVSTRQMRIPMAIPHRSIIWTAKLTGKLTLRKAAPSSPRPYRILRWHGLPAVDEGTTIVELWQSLLSMELDRFCHVIGEITDILEEDKHPAYGSRIARQRRGMGGDKKMSRPSAID
ncbi:MAG: UPF0182 family protein [Litorilinea sp.]